jgi:hypothetical protein
MYKTYRRSVLKSSKAAINKTKEVSKFALYICGSIYVLKMHALFMSNINVTNWI